MNMNGFFFPVKGKGKKRTFKQFGPEESSNFLAESKKVKLNDGSATTLTADSSLQTSPPTRNIQFTVTDPLKLSTMHGFRILQQFLLLVFSKEMVNPGWIAIKNRSGIKKAVICALEIDEQVLEDLILRKKTPFLAGFYNKANVAVFNRLFCERAFFYENLLTSKREISAFFEKKEGPRDLPEEESAENYEDRAFNKYKVFALSPEKLELNLFPNKQREIYKDYIETLRSQSPKSLNNRIFALDCEMVRTETGNELARVTLIDYDFRTLIDKLVRPKREILDYNTKFSGITEEILRNVSTSLEEIQTEFLTIVQKDDILIGHSLENDLNALKIVHDKIVDTSVLFQSQDGHKLSLRSLSEKYLNIKIQEREHDSVEDAKAALSLARLRIEILENLDKFSLLNRKPSFDILNKLLKNDKTLMILDSRKNLEPLIKEKNSIHTDELKSEKSSLEETLQKVRKWAGKVENAREPEIVLGRFESSVFEENGRFSEDALATFDEELRRTYENSAASTVFIVFTFHEEKMNFALDKSREKNDLQIQEPKPHLLEKNKGLMLFISK